jgi:dTDP-4-dehydrorhamnose reductase
MLRLGKTRDEIGVVADQIGCPTYAPHLAQAIFSIIPQIMGVPANDKVWGIYHACAQGHASWYDFACEIFRQSENRNGKSVKVLPLTTQEYPTPAQRPANSVLDCKKFIDTFGFSLPNWRQGTSECVELLLQTTE